MFIIDPVAENVTKKVDISAGLKKEGDDDKTPVDGVSSKSVNLAMGLETVAPQEKKTPLSILSLTRGLTSVSNDNIGEYIYEISLKSYSGF